MDDPIDHSLLEQELGSLEPLGELLVDRLLDDAGPGKADQRLRLREDDVAHGREARRDAARRRMGHDRDVRDSGVREPRQERVRLRHLHERENPLEHAGAPG